MKSLIALGEAKLRMFSEDQVGTQSEVLFERRNKKGLWEGYTTNFVRVNVDSSEDLKNQVRTVYINSFENNRLQADLLQ